MAFKVVYENNRSFTWHVNSKKPPRLHYDNDAAKEVTVVRFYADNDELGFIMLRLRNIPITHGGTCTWRGEMAQFIYDNL